MRQARLVAAVVKTGLFELLGNKEGQISVTTNQLIFHPHNIVLTDGWDWSVSSIRI